MEIMYLTQQIMSLGLAATAAFVIAKMTGERRTVESERGVKW
jgi:hypothetical protein